MFQWLHTRRAQPARLPRSRRVYAIGDIHGEAALFQRLLDRIERDSAARGDAVVQIVLLGDFIDRGPAAAGLMLALAGAADPRLVILKGNHEATLVAAYRGDLDALALWRRFGGLATLRGFGASVADCEAEEPAALLATLHRRIAPDMIEWLDRLPTVHVVGDYFFTHAGIRPGVALEAQVEADLLWIRRPFLASRRHHGKVVVHGHTVDHAAAGVRLGHNRIGLDTGAHEFGRLTTLGLEDAEQWTLDVADDRGGS